MTVHFTRFVFPDLVIKLFRRNAVASTTREDMERIVKGSYVKTGCHAGEYGWHRVVRSIHEMLEKLPDVLAAEIVDPETLDGTLIVRT